MPIRKIITEFDIMQSLARQVKLAFMNQKAPNSIVVVKGVEK